MITEHFILKDSGLHYVKDMPEKPTGVFRTEEIPVANHEEVIIAICSTLPEVFDKEDLEIGAIYPLECEIEIESNCECPESSILGCQKMDSVEECKTTQLTFVKLKEETKEKTSLTEIRNQLYDSLPSGEIKAWDLIEKIKQHLLELDKYIDSQDAVTKEEEITDFEIEKEATKRINHLNKKSGWRGFIEGALYMKGLMKSENQDLLNQLTVLLNKNHNDYQSQDDLIEELIIEFATTKNIERIKSNFIITKRQ